MKTTTSEVLCDHCKEPIPAMAPEAIFVTLRGPRIGHRKFDLCGAICFMRWALYFDTSVKPS